MRSRVTAADRANHLWQKGSHDMHNEKPRPHGSVTSQRAAGSEELFRGASNPPDINKQDYRQVPIAWAHIFVTRFGGVGFWIEVCPFCGFEHAHSGYTPFDLLNAQGWRYSHCTYWGSISDGVYDLRLIPSPARFAPGAVRSPKAQRTMDCLRSIGIETSSETIPCTSRELQRKW